MIEPTDDQIEVLKARHLCTACDKTGVIKYANPDTDAVAYSPCSCVKKYKNAYNMLVANIPAAYQELPIDIEDAKNNEENKQGLQLILKYITKLDDALAKGIGLYIAGVPGSGKSFLGATILKVALEKNYKAYFTYIEELITQGLAAARIGHDAYTKFQNYFQNVDILLIDDIDKIKTDEKDAMILSTILKNRYHAGKSVIITASRPKARFIHMIPDTQAIMEERMFELSLKVSYRPKALTRTLSEFFNE